MATRCQNGTCRRPDCSVRRQASRLRYQLLDSELCEQQALRRFEILEGNRLVVETLMQRSEIGEHIVLGALWGQGRLFVLR